MITEETGSAASPAAVRAVFRGQAAKSVIRKEILLSNESE